MFVGVARLVFQIPGARSLKDRRRVVRSFKDRARSRLSISIAEVGDVEAWQVATLGAAVVANESSRCAEILAQLVSMAKTTAEALLSDVRTEVLSFEKAGRGIRGGIEHHPIDEDDFDER